MPLPMPRYAAVGVEFEIQIARIAADGAEEELQAAVLTGHAQNTGVLGSDVRFLSGQADVERVRIVTDLRLGCDVRGLGPEELVDGKAGDAGPVGICGSL